MSRKQVAVSLSNDELRQEYDPANLGNGARGKYHAQAAAGTNLALIEADLARVFPDSKAVNKALRAVAEAAGETAPTTTRRRRP